MSEPESKSPTTESVVGETTMLLGTPAESEEPTSTAAQGAEATPEGGEDYETDDPFRFGWHHMDAELMRELAAKPLARLDEKDKVTTVPPGLGEDGRSGVHEGKVSPSGAPVPAAHGTSSAEGEAKKSAVSEVSIRSLERPARPPAVAEAPATVKAPTVAQAPVTPEKTSSRWRTTLLAVGGFVGVAAVVAGAFWLTGARSAEKADVEVKDDSANEAAAPNIGQVTAQATNATSEEGPSPSEEPPASESIRASQTQEPRAAKAAEQGKRSGVTGGKVSKASEPRTSPSSTENTSARAPNTDLFPPLE